METQPQVDSPQKSPVSKTLPPTASGNQDSKQPPKAGVASSSETDKKSESKETTASTASQGTPKSDPKSESKPTTASKESEDAKKIASDGSKVEDTLSHPIISVDIQKSMPYENKPDVPQESKQDSKPEAGVSPEVLASVVTTAVVNEAALTVGGADGHVINGTKFTSDSSKVDSVVQQELNKLSETLEGKTELKTVEAASVDSKTLPNGDIDYSPVIDGNVETPTKVSKEITIKEIECNAQSKETSISKSKDSIQSADSKTATVMGKETELKAQNQTDSNADQTQGTETGSCNGVPGIITVVGISKKDSTSNLNGDKEVGGLATDSRKSELTENKKEKDDELKKELPKDGKGDSNPKVSSSKQVDAKELDTLENKSLSSNSKIEIGDAVAKENVVGDNLTDSAKLQNGAIKVPEKSETTQGNELTPGKVDSSLKEKTISEDTKQKNEQQSSEKVAASETDETKKSSKLDTDKDKDTKAENAEQHKILSEKSDKPESGTPEVPKLPDTTKNVTEESKSETGVTKKEVVTKDIKENIVSEASDSTLNMQSKSSDLSSSNTASKAGDTTAEIHLAATGAISSSVVESSQTKSTDDMCDMTMMMTSQILTKEILNGDSSGKEKSEVSTTEPKISSDSHPDSKKESAPKDLKYEFEFCRISATKCSPDTCDVGVGSDQRAVIRVASGDGGEEEVDGQQATTEVEVTEEANADDSSHTSLVGDGTASPTSDKASVTSKAASTPATSKPSSAVSKPSSAVSKPSSAVSKPSSGVSKNEVEVQQEVEDKPTSAGSRSSIPEAIVYEPPERRKSAASVANGERTDEEADKSHEDEKETEKVTAEADESTEKKMQYSVSVGDQEDTKSNKEEPEADVAETAEDNADNKNEDNDKDSNVKEAEDTEELAKDEKAEKEDKEKEIAEEKEKGEVDEKDVERPESKSDGKVDAGDEDAGKTESDEKKDAGETESDEKKDAGETESDEKKDAGEKTAEKESEVGESDEISTQVEEGDSDASKDKKEDDTAESSELLQADEKAEQPVSEKEHEEKESTEVETDKADEKDTAENEEKEEEKEQLEEPKTLVEEEESKVDSAKEEEAKAEEEKEEDDTEETKEDEKVDEKAEEIAGVDEGKEAEIEADEAAETMKDEEKEEAAADDKPEEEKPQEEEDGEDAETKEKEDATEEVETKESAEGDKDEGAEKDEEAEKQTEEEDAEGKPEPPPKSPTKRVRSPDKAGRRGVSPISSPPKPLKTPPSPQKPQKTTSPKKKNGMLSPIKTPKTPGSDSRKLPPIKAPVGLAPNPNLKNIRSKIGSFDNIKYKPGGGDKKVISTKKLEWKAAPKIGSLDHSFKGGEKKQGRSHSKGGEAKEAEAKDEQSPLLSGDEAETEVASADVTETLIKQEGTAEMPVAIAAES